MSGNQGVFWHSVNCIVLNDPSFSCSEWTIKYYSTHCVWPPPLPFLVRARVGWSRLMLDLRLNLIFFFALVQFFVVKRLSWINCKTLTWHGPLPLKTSSFQMKLEPLKTTVGQIWQKEFKKFRSFNYKVFKVMFVKLIVGDPAVLAKFVRACGVSHSVDSPPLWMVDQILFWALYGC